MMINDAAMREYRPLYEYLRFPASVIQLAFGELKTPMFVDTRLYNYGFAPALLPLWSADTPTMTGYWKHWFGPRQMTLVKVSVEEGRRAYEVARSFHQLIADRLLFLFDSSEAITPELRDFALQTGITETELEQIYALWDQNGYTREALLALPLFAQNPPLACFPDSSGYPGDYPHDKMPLNAESVRHICTMEVSNPLRQQIASLPFAPPWFTTDTQRPVFDSLLQQGDYEGAWMTLNSQGWTFRDAKLALRELAAQTGVSGFDLLVDAWTAQDHEANGRTPDIAAY